MVGKNWRLSVPLLSLAATISCLFPQSALAVCLMPWISIGNRYCDGCRYESTISLNRNETCERASKSPGTSDVAYLGSRIIQKAKHGIAGANGAVIAYQPTKDFVGTDDFVMEMSFRQSGVAGKYTAHYVVTVK